MLANTMAVTELRVSYLTSTLARCNFGTSTYQSSILSLQNSKSGSMHGKLWIKSVALDDNKVPLILVISLPLPPSLTHTIYIWLILQDYMLLFVLKFSILIKTLVN